VAIATVKYQGKGDAKSRDNDRFLNCSTKVKQKELTKGREEKQSG
jgi:hypothetical protein